LRDGPTTAIKQECFYLYDCTVIDRAVLPACCPIRRLPKIIFDYLEGGAVTRATVRFQRDAPPKAATRLSGRPTRSCID
jgi:hypothetical protein